MVIENQVWRSGALIGLLLGLMPAVSLAEQPAQGETNSVTSVALEREGASQERP